MGSAVRYVAHTVWQKAARFCLVIKLDEENFSITPCQIIFLTRTLTHDLFAAANFLVL